MDWKISKDTTNERLAHMVVSENNGSIFASEDISEDIISHLEFQTANKPLMPLRFSILVRIIGIYFLTLLSRYLKLKECFGNVN